MNEYEEKFLKWLEEQKAKNIEPNIDELERRAINMAVGAGKSERLVFNDSTAKHEEE
jgi:hypothetical protein